MIIKLNLNISYSCKYSLREGVAKVAHSNFGDFLLGVGSGSKAQDLSKNTKIAGTTLQRPTALARELAREKPARPKNQN